MYTLRPGHSAEASRLQAIERQAATRFLGTPLAPAAELPVQPLASLCADLAQGRILVGVDEADEPVGFAIFDQFDSVVHLRELDVLPEHGGRGLGRQLVQAVIAWAIEHGCTAVTLTTFRDVPFNAPFYARAGFRVLTEDELTPRLAQIRAEERAHGIDLAPRVAMLRDLAGMTNQG